MTVSAFDLNGKKDRDIEVHDVQKIEMRPAGLAHPILALIFSDSPTFFLNTKDREIVVRE